MQNKERPLEPTSEYKCYEFYGFINGYVKGYVWAKNELEALEKIKMNDSDDIRLTRVDDIVDINVKEEGN